MLKNARPVLIVSTQVAQKLTFDRRGNPSRPLCRYVQQGEECSASTARLPIHIFQTHPCCKGVPLASCMP